MPWSQGEIDALRELYYKSSYYSQRFGGPNEGLGYGGIAAGMTNMAAREDWPARRYTGASIAAQLRSLPGFPPPQYLNPPYSGPPGPSNYLPPRHN